MTSEELLILLARLETYNTVKECEALHGHAEILRQQSQIFLEEVHNREQNLDTKLNLLFHNTSFTKKQIENIVSDVMAYARKEEKGQ